MLPSKYQLVFESDADNESTTAQPQQWHEVTVVTNDRVTSEDHFQVFLQIFFDFVNSLAVTLYLGHTLGFFLACRTSTKAVSVLLFFSETFPNILTL